MQNLSYVYKSLKYWYWIFMLNSDGRELNWKINIWKLFKKFNTILSKTSFVTFNKNKRIIYLFLRLKGCYFKSSRKNWTFEENLSFFSLYLQHLSIFISLTIQSFGLFLKFWSFITSELILQFTQNRNYKENRKRLNYFILQVKDRLWP